MNCLSFPYIYSSSILKFIFHVLIFPYIRILSPTQFYWVPIDLKKGPAKLPNLAYGHCAVSTYIYKFSFGEKQSNLVSEKLQAQLRLHRSTERDRASEFIKKVTYLLFTYIYKIHRYVLHICQCPTVTIAMSLLSRINNLSAIKYHHGNFSHPQFLSLVKIKSWTWQGLIPQVCNTFLICIHWVLPSISKKRGFMKFTCDM